MSGDRIGLETSGGFDRRSFGLKTSYRGNRNMSRIEEKCGLAEGKMETLSEIIMLVTNGMRTRILDVLGWIVE